MDATLSLPAGVFRWVEPRPWLRVVRADHPSVAWDHGSFPLELVRIESPGDPEPLLDRLARQRGPGPSIPVVVGSYLRANLRAALERQGIGYLDRRGNLHLPWPQGILHLEAGGRGRRDDGAPDGHVAGLGVHGVRAVQALLTSGDNQQVSQLARDAALSPSRTHAVLRLLESEGLVRATGKGPATRRHVVDRAALLDWLVAQPVARRREKQEEVAVYARTPSELWRSISERLDRAQIPHGLTGSAAAAALGAGPTSVMVSSVRISPQFTLAAAAAALGAETTERGANVKLVRDTGMLGSTHTIERDRIRIAPPVRVYLDALDERRGDAVAQGFREAILGY